MIDTTSSLATIQGNEALAKMYQESAKMGSENLQVSVPMLKVHTTNKSVGDELLNGKEPNDGWFFLTGEQRQYENPTVHILTVSRGFRAEGMVDKTTGQKGEDKFNQIVGGAIVDGVNYRPFIMYFTGIRLSKLWEFGKEVNKYTHNKPIGIPMLALTVKLSTVKVRHDYGSSYAVDFNILKKGDFPELVTDAGQFVFLRDLFAQVENTIESLIEFKSTENKTSTVEAVMTGEPTVEEVFTGEEVNEEEIPLPVIGKSGKTVAEEVADDIPF